MIWSIFCDLVQIPSFISFCWWKLLWSPIKSLVSHKCHAVTSMEWRKSRLQVNLNHLKQLARSRISQSEIWKTNVFQGKRKLLSNPNLSVWFHEKYLEITTKYKSLRDDKPTEWRIGDDYLRLTASYCICACFLYQVSQYTVFWWKTRDSNLVSRNNPSLQLILVITCLWTVLDTCTGEKRAIPKI